MVEREQYFNDFQKILEICLADKAHQQGLAKTMKLLKSSRQRQKKIMLIGNGGSSAIAEHMAVDLTKNAGLRAMTISGTPMLTTLANDLGYEKVYEKAIKSFADQGDVLIAISSSGASKNILNACKAAKAKGMIIITFSGFSRHNPLRTQGLVNFWVDSKSYGYVEIIHNLLLHYINDAIIGSVEYVIP